MTMKCITINDGFTMTAAALAHRLFLAAVEAIKIISNHLISANNIAAVSFVFRMACKN